MGQELQHYSQKFVDLSVLHSYINSKSEIWLQYLILLILSRELSKGSRCEICGVRITNKNRPNNLNVLHLGVQLETF